MKGKSLDVFVRFGGLDLKNQEGYSKKRTTFHQPPAPRGFYAMPKIAQEFFLIGSLSSTQKHIFPKEPITKGLSIEERDKVWEEHNKRREKVYDYIRREFKVKKDINIWHHLNAKPFEVLERSGTWIKTSLAVWKKAFMKESITLRIESGSGDINAVKGITGIYNKDHLEVFFDEKI